ncbi:ornithine decarboxylase antizyme with +1 programmed ribosomal shift Spa1 [Boothiomyces sp. JEL0838]|nr:ornithine decarboxylase antizyme with +1 programmed ribosomal shift Spa1 [Boothiomyces sp. JEL0838]
MNPVAISCFESIQQPVLLVSPDLVIVYRNELARPYFKLKKLSYYFNIVPQGKITTVFRNKKTEISCGILKQGTEFEFVHVLVLKICDDEVTGRYETEFEEIEPLGKGGFGQVFRARNRLDGQEYAIKKVLLNCFPEDIQDEFDSPVQLSPTQTLLNGPNSWVDSHTRRLSIQDHRVLREVITLASVSHHTNIVRYYTSWIETHSECISCDNDDAESVDSDQSPHYATLYIQMQLYKCENLREWLNNRKEINFDLNLSIFMQLVTALCHIHSQGVIHRDFKPDNIFMENGQVHVGDFGLAKNITDHIVNQKEFATEASSDLGTFFYIAPEITEESKCITKSDIYSLGVLLFELFMIFKTGMERSVVLSDLKNGRFPKEMEIKYPVVCDLVAQLTHKDAEKRPSGQEIMTHHIFNNALSGGGIQHIYSNEVDLFSASFKKAIQISPIQMYKPSIPKINLSELTPRPKFKMPADSGIFHLDDVDSPEPTEDHEELLAQFGMTLKKKKGDKERIRELEKTVKNLEARLQYMQVRSEFLEKK